MTKDWNYPEKDASFLSSGSFTACIAGSGSAKRSAAAWKVWRDDGAEPTFEAVKMSTGKSTAPRAALAAAAGVLETLRPGSSIAIYARFEYATKMINTYRQEWKKDTQQRWINAAGKEAPNSDIINRLDLVIRTRQLTVPSLRQ
jgi:ribonuclease HI